MIKRKLAGLALTAGLALAGAVTTAPSATAAPAAGCTTTTFGCMYHNDDFTGEIIEIYGNDEDLGGDGDEANSAWNNHGSYYLAMFDHTGTNKAPCIYLEPKSWVWRLGELGWADRISSIQWYAKVPAGCAKVGQKV